MNGNKVSPMAALANLQGFPQKKEHLKKIVESAEGAVYHVIEHSLIKPDSGQPRKNIVAASLQELADSIRSVGIIEPLVVRPDPDKKGQFIIVCGERRWMSADIADMKDIPCLVKDLDIKIVRAYQLIENVHREDMSLGDTAKGVRDLINEHGITQVEACRILGMSTSTLNEFVLIGEAPEFIQKLIDQGVKKRVLLALTRAAKLDEAFAKSTTEKALNDGARLTLEWAENVYRMCKSDDNAEDEVGADTQREAPDNDKDSDQDQTNTDGGATNSQQTEIEDNSHNSGVSDALQKADSDVDGTNTTDFEANEAEDTNSGLGGDDIYGPGFKKRSASKAIVSVKVSGVGAGKIALEYSPSEPDEVMVEFSTGDIKSVKIIDCVMVGYE